MSLRVWLPLNGDLRNQGSANVTITNSGAIVEDQGKTGKCYKFSASPSYLSLPKEAMTSFENQCSVCFWLKILSWKTGWDTFFQAGLGATPWNNYIFGFLRNNSSKCAFSISNGGSSYISGSCSSTIDFQLNTWYHIGLVYKTGHCLLYINGELDRDYSTAVVPDFSKITTITIGIGNNKTSYQTNCLMNDFRIYDHVLSQQEVKKIAQGLILHYPLNNRGLGQENLLKNTNVSVTNGSKTGFVLSQTIPSGTKVTFSLQIDAVDLVLSGNKRIGLEGFQNNGTNNSYKGVWITGVNAQGTYSKRIFATVTLDRDFLINNNTFGIYIQTVSSGSVTISNPKIEIGDKPTPWCPNPLDDLYTILQLNDTSVKDISGFNNNANYNNLNSIGSAQIGQALIGGSHNFTFNSNTPMYNISTIFNGSSCIKNNNFNLPGKIWTVSCWYYKPTNPTAYEGLFCLSKNAGADADKKFAAMPNTNRIWYKGETGTASIAKLELSKWTFLAMVCDGTVVKVYQNNEIIGSFNAGNEITNANDLVIGARAASTDAESTAIYFTGQMSDFRIYATALSADDIKELYENREKRG